MVPNIVPNTIMQMKENFEFKYGFKSYCKSIYKLFYKLKGNLHSRPKNNRKTFPLFGNEFLSPSYNISLTGFPIRYLLKHKDLCEYDPRCIMSSGLMFDDIIMNILRNKKLACHN